MNDVRSERPSRTTVWTRWVYRIVGAPDYTAYVEHVHRCHAGTVPLSEKEFFRQSMHDRYNRVGTRCC